MCQWHMFSTDRNEVEINAADGKIGGTIVIEASLSLHYVLFCEKSTKKRRGIADLTPDPLKRCFWDVLFKDI